MFAREKFAERLAISRKNASLTASQLANTCGLSAHTTISLLESGKRSPSVELLCSLAEALDVSVDYLLGNEDHVSQSTATYQDKFAKLSPENKSHVEACIDFLLSQQAEPR